MSNADKTWGHFFKPEVKKQGEDDLSEGLVSLSQSSDTRIRAYTKGSSSKQISFSSAAISDKTFLVDCSCPASAKGQFCRHIWATLLLVEKSYPDFLDSKTEIEKGSGFEKKSAARSISDAQAQSREAMKVKQADYRKQQYQKQKERIRELKSGKSALKKSDEKKSKFPTPRVPEDVQASLTYFSENGFEIEVPIVEEELNNAKRLLSRVFHPDKGGSHEEILTLNQHFNTLQEYGRS